MRQVIIILATSAFAGLLVLALIMRTDSSDTAERRSASVQRDSRRAVNVETSAREVGDPQAVVTHGTSSEQPTVVEPRADEAPPLAEDEVRVLMREVSECASRYDELDWDSIRQCHDMLLSRVERMTHEEQYALVSSLSDAELALLITVVTTRPWKDTEYFAPMGKVKHYPGGMLDYLLEAASGAHGLDQMFLSARFFRGCADCPSVAYEPAREVLRARTNDLHMMEAIIQLQFAPDSVGEGELWAVVRAADMAHLRAPALRALTRRGSPRAVDGVFEFLGSSNLDDVAVGVAGLHNLARNHPALLNEDVTSKLVGALDGIYGAMSTRERRAAIIALLPLPNGSQFLRTIATGEPDAGLRASIEAAARALDQGVPYRDVQRDF